MTATALRPLGIGEILDTAIKIYRGNATTLIKLVLLIIAPVTALGEIVSASADSRDPSVTFDPVTGEQVVGDDFWTIIAAALVVGLLGVLATVLATGACFKAVADAYLGHATDWRRSLGFAARRFGGIVWITFLSALVALLAAIACILPGVWLWFAFAVAVPAFLTEGHRGRRALGRSYRLVRNRWWNVFAAVGLALLLASILQGVLVGLAAAVDVAAPESIGAYIVDFVAQTLASALTTPFTAAVTVVVYFDLRVRKEAFDLELLAAQLGLEPAPGSPAPVVELVPRPGIGTLGEQQPPFWPPPPGWTPGGGPATDPSPPAAPDTSGKQPPFWPPPPGWTPDGDGG